MCRVVCELVTSSLVALREFGGLKLAFEQKGRSASDHAQFCRQRSQALDKELVDLHVFLAFF